MMGSEIPISQKKSTPAKAHGRLLCSWFCFEGNPDGHALVQIHSLQLRESAANASFARGHCSGRGGLPFGSQRPGWVFGDKHVQRGTTRETDRGPEYSAAARDEENRASHRPTIKVEYLGQCFDTLVKGLEL